jgi:dihydrofolate reductase
MQTSIDGFVAGPNGEMDWMEWNWDDELKEHVIKLTESVDCILLGRKMTQGFIQAWSSRVKDPETSDWFANKMVDTNKVVFSKTLSKSDWEKTQITNGDLRTEVNKLKEQEGGDIIVYGGAGFVSNLIMEELIDELNLFVNPTAIGNGLQIFEDRSQLTLKNVKPFSCGIVGLTYAKRAEAK